MPIPIKSEPQSSSSSPEVQPAEPLKEQPAQPSSAPNAFGQTRAESVPVKNVVKNPELDPMLAPLVSDLSSRTQSILSVISELISPDYAKKTLEARRPVTPDPADLDRVLLCLALEHLRAGNRPDAIARLEKFRLDLDL